jgi:hypothetical protein
VTGTQPLSVWLNIECDRIASETTSSIIIKDTPDISLLPPTLMPPIKGSRAMLRLGNTWVISHLQQHILLAHSCQRLIDYYCLEKYNWTLDIFHEVDWPSETIDHHLFQCPNRTLSEECSSLLSSLRKEGLKLGWPRPVLDGIIHLIQDFIEGSPPTLSGGSNWDRRSVTPMWFPLKSMDRDSGGFSCAIPTGQDHFLFMPPLAGIYGQIMVHPK